MTATDGQVLATDVADHIREYATFKAMADKFGERGVIDLIGLTGYYTMLAMVLNVAQQPLPGGARLATPAMQFVEKSLWISRFNIHYHLGVDGISLWLVPLTAFITVIVVLASWEAITVRVNQYMGAFLILSGLMVGVFSALDGMLFYVFFEATLIPMYIIIGVWGGPNRVYAAFKFFLYTLLGSVLMLAAILFMIGTTGTSSIPELMQHAFDPNVHEALTHEASDEVSEPTVVAVYQPGYRYADRVLRPARVAVAGTD